MKVFSATILLLSLLATGCNEVNPPIEGRNDPYQSKQIHFATDELRRDTAVSAPVVTRDPNGNILYVMVPIRSAINKNIYVDYRVTFFNPAGQVINQTTWFTKTLESNVPDRISVNSTTPNATEFQVDFRYAR